MDPMFAPAKIGAEEDSKGSVDWLMNEFSVMLVAIAAVERVLLENPDYAHIRQFQLRIQNGQLCSGSKTSFGVSNQVTFKIANSPCSVLWPLSWATKFSRISASRSLEIQVS